MTSKDLYFVSHTDLPRRLSEHSLVRVRADLNRSEVYEQLYSQVFEAFKNEKKREMLGQIHHLIPLYLGGGHDPQNLEKAIGNAKTPGTAHQILHDVIDQTQVEIWIEDQQKSTTLSWSDLAKQIPKRARRILIGILFKGGSIEYDEQEAMAALAK
jgi:hypothetical protein